jgi:hypothetical protein
VRTHHRLSLPQKTPRALPTLRWGGLVRGHAWALSRRFPSRRLLSLTPATTDRVALVQSRGRETRQGARGSGREQAVLPLSCPPSRAATLRREECVAARLGSAVLSQSTRVGHPPFCRGMISPGFTSDRPARCRESAPVGGWRDCARIDSKAKGGCGENRARARPLVEKSQFLVTPAKAGVQGPGFPLSRE